MNGFEFHAKRVHIFFSLVSYIFNEHLTIEQFSIEILVLDEYNAMHWIPWNDFKSMCVYIYKSAVSIYFYRKKNNFHTKIFMEKKSLLTVQRYN